MSPNAAETPSGTVKTPSDEPGPTDEGTAGSEQYGSVNPKQADTKEKEVTTAELGKVMYGVQGFGQ